MGSERLTRHLKGAEKIGRKLAPPQLVKSIAQLALSAAQLKEERMPYIPQADRDRLGSEWGEGMIPYMKTPGELNFMLTTLCLRYASQHGKSYQTFNDVIGALDGASKEFYRCHVAPYEDSKREANGDV